MSTRTGAMRMTRKVAIYTKLTLYFLSCMREVRSEPNTFLNLCIYELVHNMTTSVTTVISNRKTVNTVPGSREQIPILLNPIEPLR